MMCSTAPRACVTIADEDWPAPSVWEWSRPPPAPWGKSQRAHMLSAHFTPVKRASGNNLIALETQRR